MASLDKNFISKDKADNTYYYFDHESKQLFECKISECITLFTDNFEPLDTIFALRTKNGVLKFEVACGSHFPLYSSIEDFQNGNRLYNTPYMCDKVKNLVYKQGCVIRKEQKHNKFEENWYCYIFKGNRAIRKPIANDIEDICVTYNHLTEEFEITAYNTPLVIDGKEYKKYKTEAECLADNPIKVVRLQEETQEIQVKVIVQIQTETTTEDEGWIKLKEATKDLK